MFDLLHRQRIEGHGGAFWAESSQCILNCRDLQKHCDWLVYYLHKLCNSELMNRCMLF